MIIIQDTFTSYNAKFTFDIRNEDFVLARPDKDRAIEPFDISVINPPYFKYSAKTSPYAKATADLYRGDPNIYASFMGIVLSCLRDAGELVVISPRSFTNGLYFKGFRQSALKTCGLALVHIFKARDKVFQDQHASVLQENIICRFVKGEQCGEITVCSSACDDGVFNADVNEYKTDLIIDPSNDQKIIRIPESTRDARILMQAEELATTFEGAGYYISTGPVVEHRTREFITENTDENNTVPLYRPHNVTPVKTVWTGENKKDVAFKLNKGHEKHTLKNDTYVLLKRFSSKDEKRRLVSGIYFVDGKKQDVIGFGNKLNYIGVKGGPLSKDEAFGLTGVFNCTFMDTYFRCISGNTQVNATEIRIMKFPTKAQVASIGRQVSELDAYDTKILDAIVNPVLGITALM
jgi:adenine-specific DNA-methyltransferase